MESSHSVQTLTATFTVIECPRIHLRIKSRNVREKAEFKNVRRNESFLHREQVSKQAVLLSSSIAAPAPR